MTYNAKTIVRIKAYDKERATFIHYMPYQKGNFFKSERKEGFYSYGDFYTAEELLKKGFENCGVLIIDNYVYFKPFVRITYLKGSETIEKDTFEEAKKYKDKLIELNKDFIPVKY